LEEASRKVYDTLIKSVNDNIGVFYQYFDVKKRSQGLNDFYVYDQYVREKSINKKYTFNEAIDIIKKATSVLGEEYTNLLDRAVKERWIDIYPNENKDSGLFRGSLW
jgi:oligoendopeptidase F